MARTIANTVKKLLGTFSGKVFWYLTLTILIISWTNANGQRTTKYYNKVKIGAIFTEDQKDSPTELAFKYAVFRINKDQTVLPNTTLVYDIQYVPKEDSFHAAKKACVQINGGSSAIFGPQDPLLANHIQSLCDALDIPHIEMRLDIEPDIKEFSINLHPSPQVLGRALLDLVTFLNWTRIAVLYEDDAALICLQELVRQPLPKNIHFLFRKTSADSFRDILRDVKARGIYSIIVDTKPDNLPRFLRSILQVQMNDYKYYYHFITFDIEVFNLEDFLYNFVNITAYRLVDTSNNSVRQVLRDMEKFQPIGQHILNKTNVIKVGEWHKGKGLNITNYAAFQEFGAMNISLKVTTIESIPYVMVKNNLTGNARFEGFCIDLLKAIAELLNFNYELYLVPDRKFGAENTTTREWNGLVREIIDKNADLAVAPMTINYARESVIHFTKPFMNLGIGILFKIPKSLPVRLFSFMSPLAVDIWLYILAAYILVSSTMFIVARFSPYEWRNPHPCVNENDVVENQFSLANSFWFTIVTLMHQGCDVNPKATSTRIIGAIWWFFTLIIISSYTANLAAFLTVERMITPIESVEDLAEQNKIAYGTLEGGSTMTFFRDSKIETYQKMWRFMEGRPSVFVTSYEEGVKRVLDGNYAFLMESTMLDYMVQRNCNLTQVGGLLDSKGYGIATPMGSPWRDRISLAILDLQEKGVIQMLYNKWWKSPGVSCTRDDKAKDGKANALGVDNIGGVFVVLLCGLAIAVFTAIMEFCWNSRRNAQSDRQSICSEMAEELRFAARCRASRQRPALRRHCSKCIPGTTYVPAPLDMPQENGIMQMIELRKSPIHFDCSES